MEESVRKNSAAMEGGAESLSLLAAFQNGPPGEAAAPPPEPAEFCSNTLVASCTLDRSRLSAPPDPEGQRLRAANESVISRSEVSTAVMPPPAQIRLQILKTRPKYAFA